ncbi:MAG: ATP-binding protein [Dehalococcoidia bacterium]|nr:ATP-binding protein [Dehalococcoidia bacterium]
MEEWGMEEFLDELETNEATQMECGDEDIAGLDLYIAGDGFLMSREEELVRRYIGTGRLSHAPLEAPRCYDGLLAWALQRYVEQDGWTVHETLGMAGRPPGYDRVNTAPGKWEHLLQCGILLLSRHGHRLVVSISASPIHSELLALSLKSDHVTARRFTRGVERVMQRQNIYRGHKIQFGTSLRFLELTNRDWSDITLPSGVKEAILSHTVDFLHRTKELSSYGIAPRRGLLLTGRPGTGKTLVCKVLMSHSPGISCVVAHASGLQHGTYIDEVYRVANDIRPTIVILEDIDLIGQDRQASWYVRSESLAQLLYQLDGVEDCRDVVTIATTNVLDILDEALKDRPSRFDRVIAFQPPDLEQRRAYIGYLARRIPVPPAAQEHLVRETEGLTPAQLQEVVHSIVIEAGHITGSPRWTEVFSPEAIDAAVALMRRRAGFECLLE